MRHWWMFGTGREKNMWHTAETQFMGLWSGRKHKVWLLYMTLCTAAVMIYRLLTNLVWVTLHFAYSLSFPLSQIEFGHFGKQYRSRNLGWCSADLWSKQPEQWKDGSRSDSCIVCVCVCQCSHSLHLNNRSMFGVLLSPPVSYTQETVNDTLASSNTDEPRAILSEIIWMRVIMGASADIILCFRPKQR